MKKVRGPLTVIAAAVLAVALASCSTVPYAQRPRNITRVIDLFNSGNVARLDQISQVPFLFNGEIVELKGDVNMMWSNLVASGLKIEHPRIVATDSIGPRSYLNFADTFSVKVFFQRYIPRGTALTRVGFAGGSFELLLGGRKRGFPVVVGIKAGPT